MSKLILKRRAEIMDEFALNDSKKVFFLGSDARNDFVIEDQKVSIKHLKIECIDNNFYVEDLNSAFGTQLNGMPLLRREQIVHEDELTIGDFSLVFNHQPGLKSAPSTPEEGEFIEIIGDDDFSNGYGRSRKNPERAVEYSPSQTRSHNDDEEFYEVEEPDDKPGDTLQNSKPDQVSGSRSFYLLAIEGPYIGKRFALSQGETKIGRDNTLNDIVIRYNEDGLLDPSISRRHATITYRKGLYFLTDKRSQTRTYINQIKLPSEEELPVYENDEIEIVSDQKSTIFRMLPDGKYDISPPKKSSVWWTRNKLRLGTYLTLIFALTALTAIGLSCQMRIANAQKPGTLQIVEKTWYLDSSTIEAGNGHTDQLIKMTHLAATDLDGNGSVDLVFTTQGGTVMALDGVSRKTLWSISAFQVKRDIPIVLSDMNLDGIKDLLIVGNDFRLHAIDGSNGVEIWLSPLLGESISGPALAADFNQDGSQDIAICLATGRVYIGYGDLIGMTWKIIETGLTIQSIPAAGDWDRDGFPELFLGTEEGKILIIDAEQGEVSLEFDFNEEVSKATGSFFGEHHLRYPIGLEDLNGNGTIDMIVGATNGNYLAIEGESMIRQWFESLPVAFTVNESLAPLIGNFDEDERPEVALVSNQMVKVVKTAAEPKNRKSVLWEYNLGGDDIFITPPTLVDLNKDKICDVIIGTNLGHLLVLNGKNGEPFSNIVIPDIPVISPILAADMGGDGLQSIMYARQNGHLYQLQTNSPINQHSVVWGQMNQNEAHSSKYIYTAPQPTTSNRLAAISGVLFLGFGALTFRARRQRQQAIGHNQKTEFT